MAREIKLVRVYIEDWNELNDLLLVEQARQKKRLSFPELVHELLELRKKLEKGEGNVLPNVQGS